MCLNLREICKASHEAARDAGWLEKPRTNEDIINLFVSELSEMLEDYRANRGLTETYFDGKKPCGIPTEASDFVIRVCEYVGTNKLIDAFVDEYECLPVHPDDITDLSRALFVATKHSVLSYRDHGSLGAEELAYAVRVIAAFAEKNGIPLRAAIEEKHAYNLTRSHRHGGKKI